MSVLSSVLSRPASSVVRRAVRDLVDEILAGRRFASPEDVDALRREVDAARSPAPDARVEALEKEVAALKKKLSMAQGALQAAAMQLADARKAADEALAVAKQASQQATSALATAESAAEGIGELEASTAERPSRAKASGGAAGQPVAQETPMIVADVATDDACAVPGCDGKHRAKGFCARHYQQWKRGSLPDFVLADGTIALADGTKWKVATEYAGLHVQALDGRLFIQGSAIHGEPV